jgi:hypothetical protein
MTPEFCERCGKPLGGGAADESAPQTARYAPPALALGSDVLAGPTMSDPQAPPVWKWYVAYCAAMAFMYLVVVIMGVVFLALPAGSDMNPQEAWFIGLVCIGLGTLCLVPYAAAPFLPRRRWAWVVGVVLIGIGMTSMCCLPAAIPLLIFWLKPESKAFFGA